MNYCSMAEQPKLDCLHCKKVKPLTLFKKDPPMPNGRMRMCYDCYNVKYRTARKTHPKIEHLPGEEWKFISETGNNYKISNKGRIMVINYRLSGCPKIIVIPTQKKGYKRVSLIDRNGKKKNYSAHRLVAQYFIPNPQKHPVVNHLNGVTYDNRAENLEWCTYSQNSRHAFDTGLKSNAGQNHSATKLLNEEVKSIKVFIAQGYDLRYILSKYPKTTLSALDRIRAGKTWTHIKV